MGVLQAGLSSVGRCRNCPHARTQPMPASSKWDPPPAKAEPVSDSGSGSGITYLRRGKKVAVAQKLQPERRVRTRERNSPADPQVSEAGQGGGGPGTRTEIPLQPVGKTMMRHGGTVAD